MEQAIRRRKRRKMIAEIFLETPTDDLVVKLVKILREHIGQENAISVNKLFYQIFNRQLSEIEFYKSYFYMQKLRYLLGVVRRKEGIVVISSKHSGIYVLKTLQEYENEKNRVMGKIDGYHKKIKTMKDWVREEKWKRF